MSLPRIEAERIGKRYALGHRISGGESFREMLGRKLRRSDTATEQFWALKDISFEIEAGDVVGIVGRNGAGKSTLLKILSRITRPTEGKARVRGTLASLLEVGTGFHGELTGRENIFLNGSILGMSRREIASRFDEIVEFAGVEEFLDTPVKRYSSGMYVRLAFAVAAHLEPDVLVIDEVLSVGDAEFQKKSLGKMREVGRGGRTVLFVSHNMNAVEQLCGSVMLLDRGRMTQFSTDVRGTINNYLWSVAENAALAEWRNSSDATNEWFQPLRLWIGSRQGSQLEMPIANTDEAWVHVEGIVGTPDDSLTIGYALFDEGGTLLYWSYQSDAGEAERAVLKRGLNHIAGPVPRRLLNEGRYRIELIGGLHFRQWLFEPGVSPARIELQIKGGLSDSPLWMMKRPGVLAPVIKWEAITDA